MYPLDRHITWLSCTRTNRMHWGTHPAILRIASPSPGSCLVRRSQRCQVSTQACQAAQLRPNPDYILAAWDLIEPTSAAAAPRSPLLLLAPILCLVLSFVRSSSVFVPYTHVSQVSEAYVASQRTSLTRVSKDPAAQHGSH
ncbi:hypothetical protein CCM_03794 [Cordyceps militaris CM01]|uniref:Uncharacterized protein n=1 Tax=Cordyceps militaris (strain CM01) TaxID=983644 RepID=G3JGQ7_CORMM|nr:uncharacterized protein CCM_03794 [Cordyceps militaris CM01]EGX92421.1 hypothetical protein CCM_03794 [Cordyceps militaris CM01]